MSAFRWGILGLGKIAHKFAADLKRVEGAELFAVASRSTDRSKAFAEAYGVANFFGSYEGILESELDAVYVATPHVRHKELSLMLLKAGIPVLCEKAFGLNEQEVQQMVDLARSKQVFLMEALWTRFLPNMLAVRKRIEQQEIGALQSITADFGFKAAFDPEKRLFNPALGGGALLDIGIYPVFLAYSLLGEPDEIQAIATRATTNVDEEIGILFSYADGRQAHLQSSFRYTSPCEAMIYGELGTIKMHTRWHESKSHTVAWYDPQKNPLHDSFEYQEIGYAFETKHVMDQVRAGNSESPIWSLDDSLALIRMLDRIRAIAGIVYPQDME